MNQYFSHDFKARSDQKLVKLSMNYGMAGVGIFWCIIEMLYEENGKIEHSECDRIAFELRDNPDSIKAIIEESGLFEYDEKYFWSKSVNERLKIREEKSAKARKSARCKWNANALRTHVKRNANKVKKSKEKENKENINTPSWKTEFDKYLELVYAAKIKILSDTNLMNRRILYFEPNLDVEKSLEKSILNFWGTEKGWKNKKKSKSKEINMVETLIKNIDKNKVFKQRFEEQITEQSSMYQRMPDYRNDSDER